MINIEISTKGFDKLLADFPNRFATAQKRTLEAIGTEVSSRAERAFRSETLRPSPWAPRKPSKRDDGHPLLIKHPHGGLWKSIRHRLEGSDTVVVGSDKGYAGYHQFGTKRMPARPYFPIDQHGRLTPAMESKIQGMAGRIYEDELKKLGGNS